MPETYGLPGRELLGRQDPQASIRSVLHETGETWCFFPAQVVVPYSECTLYSLAGEKYLEVHVLSPDKYEWGPRFNISTHHIPEEEQDHKGSRPDPYDCQDTLLYSIITHESESVVKNSHANTNLVPVLALLKNEQIKRTKPLFATLLEGIRDFSITYDRSTNLYQIWYWAYAWTSCSVANDVGPNRTPSTLATLAYDQNDACEFDKDNFFIVPQQNLRYRDMPKAVRILLHTKGRKFNFRKIGGINLPGRNLLDLATTTTSTTTTPAPIMNAVRDDVITDLPTPTTFPPEQESTLEGNQDPYLLCYEPEVITIWPMECEIPIISGVIDLESTSSTSSSTSSTSSFSSTSSTSSTTSTSESSSKSSLSSPSSLSSTSISLSSSSSIPSSLSTSQSDVSEQSSSSKSATSNSISSVSSPSSVSAAPCLAYVPRATRNGDYLRLPKARFKIENGQIVCDSAGFDEVYICCDFL